MEQSLLTAAVLGALLAAPAPPAAAAAACQQELTRPQGVTLPENREILTLLADADRLLADGSARSGLALLQQVLLAERGVVVRTNPDDLLYAGVRALARQRLAALEGEAAEAWEALSGAAAAEVLDRALEPPDPQALLDVARAYPGTRAAARAAAAAAELFLDRGDLERALASGAEFDLERWAAALPAGPPRAPVLAPTYSGVDDPALPLLRGASLRPSWSYQFPDSGVGMAVNHRMAMGAGLGYLTDGHECVALDLATGTVRWRFEVPGWSRLSGEERKSLERGFEPQTLLAPVLAEGLVLAALQEPVRLGRDDDFRGIRVRNYLPGRRLYAFDATTGAVRWTQAVDWLEGEQPLPRGLVAAPPAVAAGKVFVPVYDAPGSMDLSLLALDLASGRPLWQTFLVSAGRETTNLFGNVLAELAAGPPVADARRVLLCTNLGAVCALDPDSGETLWTRLYERTPVQTSQTGREGDRDRTFDNGAAAYDGRIFACAPVDSQEALAVDADSGALLALWPSRRSYSRLLALLPEGVYCSGRRAGFLALPGYGARLSESQPAITGNDSWAGLLAQGEFLLPTNSGIARLDPVSWRELGPPIPWQPEWGGGGLQAGPGVLVVLRRGGVSAYNSPDALVEYLARAGRDPARLTEVIPYLEALEPSDALVAQRVADAARELAALAPSREAAERLSLVCGKACLDAGAALDAADVMEPLLRSLDERRRQEAAALLVQALERRAPAHAALERALKLLEQAGSDLVARRGGDPQPLAIVAARARWFAAVARGDAAGRRHSLVSLLQAPDPGAVTEEDLPVQEWARRELERLCRDGTQRASLEQEAARAFAAAGEPTEGLLRAYAGTPAATVWLRRAQARTDLTRGERVRLAAWLRDYGGAVPSHLLDPASLFAAPTLPALPRELGGSGTWTLEDDRHAWSVAGLAAPAPGRTRLLLRDRGELRLLAGAGGDLTELWRRPQPGPAQGGRGGVRAFVSDEAVTLVFHDRWLRWDDAGMAQETVLPGRADGDTFTRWGRMLGYVCRTSATQGQLQVRDLDSGALFLNAPVACDARAMLNLLLRGDALLLLASGRDRALRFDPLRGTRPTPVPLQKAATTDQVFEALRWSDGLVALAQVADRRYALLACRPESSFQVPLPSPTSVYLFGAPGGIGWLLESNPLPSSRNAVTEYQLYWLADGADQPRRYDFPPGRLVVPPELKSGGKPPFLPSAELLFLTAGPAQEVLLRAVRCDAPDGPQPLWQLERPDLSFNSLQRRPIVCLRGAEGWVVALHQNATRGPGKVQVMLLDLQGRILAQTALASTATPELFPLAGQVLLRAENVLHWLGQP